MRFMAELLEVRLGHQFRIKGPTIAERLRAASEDNWYVEAGGPLALWRAWADVVQGRPVPGGHFFPEEIPNETAEVLKRFVSAD